jgi:hypothetical protein
LIAIAYFLFLSINFLRWTFRRWILLILGHHGAFHFLRCKIFEVTEVILKIWFILMELRLFLQYLFCLFYLFLVLLYLLLLIVGYHGLTHLFLGHIVKSIQLVLLLLNLLLIHLLIWHWHLFWLNILDPNNIILLNLFRLYIFLDLGLQVVILQYVVVLNRMLLIVSVGKHWFAHFLLSHLVKIVKVVLNLGF